MQSIQAKYKKGDIVQVMNIHGGGFWGKITRVYYDEELLFYSEAVYDIRIIKTNKRNKQIVEMVPEQSIVRKYIKRLEMGTDIHMYMEYHSRKKKRFVYGKRFVVDRLYGLFEIMANICREVKPLYEARGLPDDVTPQVLKSYKDYGGDAHHASWLTSSEFKECLDKADSLFSNDAPEDRLKSYKRAYSYLYDSDKEGEPSRVVFWFDN